MGTWQIDCCFCQMDMLQQHGEIDDDQFYYCWNYEFGIDVCCDVYFCLYYDRHYLGFHGVCPEVFAFYASTGPGNKIASLNSSRISLLPSLFCFQTLSDPFGIAIAHDKSWRLGIPCCAIAV